MTFEVTHRGEPLGPFAMPLYGVHNVKNVLAALAVGSAVGLSTEEMRRGLTEFKGVQRRLELRGTVRGVAVYDDFAHHPTAILETVRAIRSVDPGRRVWAVFEPRSATACRRIFQQDFVRAFADSGADEIILAAVFRTTLPDEERLSIADLVHDLERAGHRARSIPRVDDIVATIVREARDGDRVVIMSNGGFDAIHDKLLQALESNGSAPL
jgi:UDP-N-acetylmuramate: L-alanyl-gamma-D-glutamyl-meso-diaminopimelate ligase